LAVLQTLTLNYDAQQDRILVVSNVGKPDAWSCWLTRRLAIAILQRAANFVVETSPVAKSAPAEFRGDVASFEREAALAQTAGAMSRTDDTVVKQAAPAAELIDRFTVNSHGEAIRLELHGDRGGQVIGDMARPQFQRVLQMVADEAAKAEWLAVVAPRAEGPAGEPAPAPLRH
jgi:hypothetical protein